MVFPYGEAQRKVAFDLHCPFMSLPACFGAATDAAAPVPYFRIGSSLPQSIEHDEPGELQVGLVWAGRPTLAADASRSIDLDHFHPLRALANVKLHSLQLEDGWQANDEWRLVMSNPMRDEFDFLDTANVIAHLDAVVAVDTAVAHLAGAMGVPVWLLNRVGSEWRWGLAGERSHWYPTLRIVRQQYGQDWAPAIARVVAEVGAIARSGRSAVRHSRLAVAGDHDL